MNSWGDPEHCASALTWSFRNRLVTSQYLRPGISRGSMLGSLGADGMTQISGPHRIVSGGDLEVERQGKLGVKQTGVTGREKMK